MKTLHLVLGAALLATPLAACGGDAPPAVQESRVEEARLQEFADLLPAAPRDWTASPVATSTGDKISSISKTDSSAKGDAFSVEINFSNEETAKMQTLASDDKARGRAGVQLAQLAGRDALSFSHGGAIGTPQYVVVLTPSRFVSVTPRVGDPGKPIMRAVFEQIYFDSIAEK